MVQVLVVDDDPYVARTLVDLLAAHGYDGIVAESGERALEIVAMTRVGLVLLDVRLPGLDGFETCARMRQAEGPSLPILLLTAFPDVGSLREGYDAGADDFLQKPIDVPHLMLKVRAFLRQKSLHDEIDRNREEAQGRARDLALLHEIGRDWSLIGEPEAFTRMVTERLAGLIGAPLCLVALYDSTAHTMAAALPVFGMSDDQARELHYVVKPEYRSLWNFRSGRPYVSNRARTDPRLLPEMVQRASVESAILTPMISEGRVIGLLVALNKPGGFTEADAQLLSIFAGPAASFVRSRQVFERQRRHSQRLERLSTLAGDMAAASGRGPLLELTVTRIQRDLGYARVSFHVAGENGFLVECEAGERRAPDQAPDAELLRWALRGAMPLQAATPGASELAIPVRAGDQALGVLEIHRSTGGAFEEEELNLLSALAGQLAVTLQKAESAAQTERLARQMATLYDVGLETTALRDLRLLFAKATAEAGRLIRADHTSVLRLEPAEGVLRFFAAWARDPSKETFTKVAFRMGEGIAGRVARDRVPAMVNDPDGSEDFVRRGNVLARLVCVPLTYYEHPQGTPVLFGVLNATRRTGGAPFTAEDLEYLTRFASQLAIAVANSVAFAAERERSEQLALVNALLREISGNLSRERILDTAVQRIQEAFRFPVVCIASADSDGGHYRLEACVSRDSHALVGSTHPLHGGIIGRAFREGQTVLVPDVTADPDYIRAFPTSLSQVAVPLRSGDEVVAVLSVEGDARGAFNPSHVITLETLADGIAIILRNAELYQALERTNLRLVELDRTKSELVNIVAHDFRAPLAGVLGHAELLEWRPDAPREDRLEQARAIIHAATHMANLVDKTLKTTRLETGQFPFDFGVIDLAAACRDLVSRLPVRESHPLELRLPEDPVPCWADRDRMAEVLDNLVSNAVKYSPEGGPVSLQVERRGDDAVVIVSDSGMGIAPEDHGRLFRPFSRVRNRETAHIEGSGLGLYICERIVRAHGGRLFLESQRGEGAVFSFTLPLFGAMAQMRAPVILVGAADERTRREVRRVAEEHGFSAHEVADGVEVVEAALRLVPAAIVLDRVLPRLRADEVAERLQDHPVTTGIPLFVLASRSDLGDRAALFEACIPKPLDLRVLEESLRGLSAVPRHS